MTIAELKAELQDLIDNGQMREDTRVGLRFVVSSLDGLEVIRESTAEFPYKCPNCGWRP